MTAFSIRPAGPADTAVVAQLFRDYAAGLSVNLSYQGFEHEVATLPGAYAPPAGALLLAVAADGDPLGCVAVRTLHAAGGCEMKRLHVAAAARKSGIGRALALAAIEAARHAGYRSLHLDTLPDMHAAQALYRDLGFEITPAYYQTPVAGTIFMRKTLALA